MFQSRISLKKSLCVLLFLLLQAGFCTSFANKNSEDIKQKAYALYATKNFNEASALLKSLPAQDKNEEVFLILANIAEENSDYNLAIKNLNKALDKNYSYYKAYYNLGCVLAKKKSYLLAIDNFELAIKYKKDFASAYYNLACCQIQLKNYAAAKKNLIKAIELEPTIKDAYYNLALCYKELNKPHQAKKLLKTYESLT